MSVPGADIIIVNYNNVNYLKNSIRSVLENTVYPYQIYVVDNGSIDGSVDYLKSFSRVNVILNQKNRGFAAACNQGLLAGEGEYIVILDCSITVTRNWLEELIRCDREDTAVIGPRVINKSGEELAMEKFPADFKLKEGTLIRNSQIEEHPVAVGGACYLIKRSNIPGLGLLDEKFMYYYEEADYSLRAIRRGLLVRLCPRARVCYPYDLSSCEWRPRELRARYLKKDGQYLKKKWGFFAGSRQD